MNVGFGIRSGFPTGGTRPVCGPQVDFVRPASILSHPQECVLKLSFYLRRKAASLVAGGDSMKNVY
jgi:hypothetical protein